MGVTTTDWLPKSTFWHWSHPQSPNLKLVALWSSRREPTRPICCAPCGVGDDRDDDCGDDDDDDVSCVE